MNANANPNFQYVMPEDEDDEYEEDNGDELVDMEDDEAQRENDQLQANKVGGTALMEGGENDPDENAAPLLDKVAAQQQFGQAPVATTNL